MTRAARATLAVLAAVEALALLTAQSNGPAPPATPHPARTPAMTGDIDVGNSTDPDLASVAANETTATYDTRSPPPVVAAPAAATLPWLPFAVLGALIVALGSGLALAWLRIGALRDELGRVKIELGLLRSAARQAGESAAEPAASPPTRKRTAAPARVANEAEREPPVRASADPPAPEPPAWTELPAPAPAPVEVTRAPPPPPARAPRRGDVEQLRTEIARLIADHAMRGTDYDALLRTYGEVCGVRLDGDQLRLVDAEADTARRLSAVVLTGTDAVAIVPSARFVKNFEPIYKETLEAGADVSALFECRADGSAALRLERVATASHDADGALRGVEPGALSGFVR